MSTSLKLLKDEHSFNVDPIFNVLVTISFGLRYSFDTNYSLVGFSDADWASYVDDHKVTTGGCFSLGNNFISWHSKEKNFHLTLYS